MTEYDVTPNDKHYQSALIDSPDFIKDIVQTTLQEILHAEMLEHIGAEPYERSNTRTTYRNGSYPRTLNLAVGRIQLRVPQARDGSFETKLFEKYQRSERALTLAVIEMWIKGVSTRNVAAVTDALSSVTFSKSTVSDLCSSLDKEINEWRSRDLSRHTYPYLFVDALYEDVRVGGSVVSEGVLIICGVRDDGRREVLDAVVADTESAASYNDMFSSLKERGLSGVMMITSDAHSGLVSAIKRYFHGACWQRCQVHFMREAVKKVSPKRKADLTQDLQSIFGESDKEAAMKTVSEVAEKWRDISPRVTAMIDEGIEQCLNILAFPEDHQIHLRTNNMLERLNEEIRRRDRAINVFPNEASVQRVVCTICMEKSEQWLTTRPFLDMNLLYADDEPIVGVIAYREMTERERVAS